MDGKLNVNDFSAVAEDGQVSRIDENTLQCTPCPIAASTVDRLGKAQPNLSNIYGSFLDQDMSTMTDISPEMQHQLRLSFGGMVLNDGRPISSQSQVYSSSSQTSNTDRCQDSELSARSSLGIINVNQMDYLEHSILSLDSIKMQNGKPVLKPSKSSLSSSKSSSSIQESQSWDGGSKDSKSFPPIGRSNIETVKKKPNEPPQRSSLGRKLANQAALMFGGEVSEADTSVYEVEFNAKELDQLDADFSDVGDIDDSDSDSGMELNEPPPAKECLLDFQNTDSFKKFLRRSDNFAGEGQDTEQESNGPNSDRFVSLYLRPVPHSINDEKDIPFKSDIFGDDSDEDNTLSLEPKNHQSQLQRLRHSQHSSDIDTEDELEAARKDLAANSNSRRNYMNEVGQRPGLEGETSDSCGMQPQNGHPLGFRQSAEGDVVTSPVPGDGGGGGDGSSGSESEAGSTQQRLPHGSRSNFSGANQVNSAYSQQRTYLKEERVKPLGEDLMSDSRYNSAKKHMVKNSFPQRVDAGRKSDEPSDLWPVDKHTGSVSSSVGRSFGSTLSNNSTLCKEVQPSFKIAKVDSNSAGFPNTNADPGLRLDASGYNANDSLQNNDNPLDCFASSFGSFGLSPQSSKEKDKNISKQGMCDVPETMSAAKRMMDPHLNTTCDSPVFIEKTKPGCKKYISENSPVYVDETGEVVTDLAFHCEFPDISEQKDLIAEEEFNVNLEDTFSTPDMAKKMLDDDEEEFVKDRSNIFIQDANMAAAAGGDFFDSSFVSSLALNATYNTAETELAYMRISIGAYMASRTEALGSLDGDRHLPRPEFGMLVKTPPGDRKPISLFEASSREEDTTITSNSSRPDGVGNEQSDQTLTGEQILTLDDLGSGHKIKKPRAARLNELIKNAGPNNDSLESNMSDISGSSLSNKTGVLDMSTIGKFINSLSPNSKSKNIADLLMHLSNAKAAEKRKPDEAPQQKPATCDIVSAKSSDIDSSKPANLGDDTRQKRSRLPVKLGSNLSQSCLVGDASKPTKEQLKKKRTASSSSLEREKTFGNQYLPEDNKNNRKERDTVQSDIFPKPPVHSKTENKQRNPDDNLFKRYESKECRQKESSSFADAESNLALSESYVKDNLTLVPPETNNAKYGHTRENVVDSLKSREPSIEKARDYSVTIHSPPREKFVHLYDTITTIDTLGSPHKDLETTSDKISETYDSRSPRLSIGYFSRTSEITNDSNFKPKLDFISEVEDGNVHQKIEKMDGRDFSEYELDNTIENKLLTDNPSFPEHNRDNVPADGQAAVKGSSKFKPFSSGLHVSVGKEPTLSSSHHLSPSKYSTEWTGHHIPDGTDYSPVSMQRQSGNDSRQFIAGTSDIQTAQSRGFDVINERSVKDSSLTESLMDSHSLTDEQRMSSDAYNFRSSLDNFTALQADRHSIYNHPHYQNTAMDNSHFAHVTMEESDSVYHPLNAVPATPSFRILDSSILTLVEAPGNLQFPNVCCVGTSSRIILPLHNPTSRWVECMIFVKSLKVDGRIANSGTDLPFDFKRKVIIQPLKSEDITVIFLPRASGSYVTHLQIISAPFRQESHLEDKIPTEVTIQAVAENPQIMVLTEESGLLNFNEVQWGCMKCETFKIINVGRALVPLRLSINSRQSMWNCFSFDTVNGREGSVISNASRSGSPALGTVVINFPLYGCDDKVNSQPIEVNVFCTPPARKLDRGLTHSQPENISAIIDINLDVPNASWQALHQLVLNATVGAAKLHIHRDLDVIALKAASGEGDKTMFNLKNVGNLNLHVQLSIPDCRHVFTIVPTNLTIPPAESGKVTILFSPKDDNMSIYKTVMFMKQEPGDLVFELDLEGRLAQKAPPVSKQVSLLSDKRLLAFGGVQIGDVGQQKLTLLNNSDQSMKVHVEVHSSSSEFKIQSKYGGTDKASSVRDLVLYSKEKYPLFVFFLPQTVSPVSSKLVIKPCDVKSKFSIPMIGYGGLSKIILEKVNSSAEDKFWIDLGIFESGKSIVGKVTVYNIGERAAYVCASHFSDIHCKHPSPAGRIAVEPSSFVIKKNDKKSVTIVYHPSAKEEALCAGKQEMLAAVAFYFGDELSRVKFRRAMSRGCGKYIKLSPDDPRVKMKFDCKYIYEDCLDVKKEVAESYTVDCSNDVDNFYKGMSKVVVSLLGEARKSENSSSNRSIHRSLSLKALPHSRQNPTPLNDVSVSRDVPVFNDQNSMSPKAKNSNDKENENWILQPEQLVLHIDSTVEEKFQIINFTNRNMKFDLYWPGHWVVVTPESGTVGARSPCTVSISPSAQISRNVHSLPWSGSVVVTCDSQFKMLKVQIRKSSSRSEGPLGNSTSSSSSLTTNPSSIPPQCPSLDVDNTNYLIVSSKEIKFSKTETEHNFEIKSICLEPVEWMISPFAPAYVKGVNESASVYRVEETVFKIDPLEGILKPSQSEKICVLFQARCKGAFNQTWDIQYRKQQKKLPGMSSSKWNSILISVAGEGVPPPRNLVKKEVVEKSTSGPNKDQQRKSSSREQVVLMSEKLVFQSEAMHKNVKKFELKNLSGNTHEVKVEPPNPPFYVKHTHFPIQSRKFLKFPVEFRPHKEGLYTGQLTLHVDNGCQLNIELEGTCGR